MISEQLGGGDLRSIGKSNTVAAQITSADAFDELVALLQNPDRKIAMRAADIMEKVSLEHPEWLQKHKPVLLQQLETARHKELQWHLAPLVSRLNLSADEAGLCWHILSGWMTDTGQSRIVRVFSMQALYNISRHFPELETDLSLLMEQVSHEQIPSLQARLRRLKGYLNKQKKR